MAQSYRDEFFVARDVGETESRAWLAENGHSVHRALAPPFTYDSQRANPNAPVSSKPPEIPLDPFNQAMAIFKASNKDKSLATLDLSRSHSWDEVIQQYIEAERLYQAKAHGLGGILRKSGRFVGNNASSADAFVRFIPQGTYTSMVSAGLYLIFGAAGRMSSRREQILDHLGEVPKAIANAEECCMTLPTDSRLHEARDELYLALLVSIMNMMQWLLEPSARKQIKALLQGPRYGSSLEDSITTVRKRSKLFEERVNTLSLQMTARTDVNTQRTEKTIQVVNFHTEQICSTTRMTATHIDELVTTADEIKVSQQYSQQHLGNKLDNIHQGMEAQSRENKETQNKMQDLLKESMRQSEWKTKFQKASRQREEAQRACDALALQLKEAQLHAKYRGMLLDSAHLLDVLAVDPNDYSHDIECSSRQGQHLEASSHSRGQQLIRSAQFQAWITKGSSGSLFVDDAAHAAPQRISIMTFACAMILDSLQDEPAIPIHHFCGLHTAHDDPLQGPSGMMRALLAQLLRAHSFHVGFSDANKYHQLQHFSLKRLCDLLVDTIRQLPSDVVLFCVVDGPSLLYDKQAGMKECQFILETLIFLTQDLKVEAVFKVLVTNPMINRYPIEHLHSEDHLTLRQGPLKYDDVALTRRQIMMQSQRVSDEGDRRLWHHPPELLPSSSTEEDDEGFVDGDDQHTFEGGDFEEDLL